MHVETKKMKITEIIMMTLSRQLRKTAKQREHHIHHQSQNPIQISEN